MIQVCICRCRHSILKPRNKKLFREVPLQHGTLHVDHIQRLPLLPPLCFSSFLFSPSSSLPLLSFSFLPHFTQHGRTHQGPSLHSRSFHTFFAQLAPENGGSNLVERQDVDAHPLDRGLSGLPSSEFEKRGDRFAHAALQKSMFRLFFEMVSRNPIGTEFIFTFP